MQIDQPSQACVRRPSLLPWFGWFFISLGSLYQFFLQTSPSVMIPSFEKNFALDSFGVSLLSSSFFYTYLIFQIPAGILIDYFQARRTIFICLCMMSLSCLLFANANSVATATASRMLMGFFGAPSFIAAFYVAARSLPNNYFTLVGGLTETLGMMGGVVGEALIARSLVFFDWRHTMVILAMGGFLLALLVWFFVRDQPQTGPASQQRVWQDLLCIIQLPQAWINGIFSGLLFSLVSGFAAFWCVPFLMEKNHLVLSKAADMSSIIFIGTAMGTPLIGALSDRIAHRRFLMLIGAILACLTSIAVIYFSPVSLLMMIVLLFFLGFFSGVYLLPFAVIRDITPAHRRGTAMGYINMMCILIGAPILQPLIGWILHLYPTLSLTAYHHALMVVPISLMIAIVLAWFVVDELERQ